MGKINSISDEMLRSIMKDNRDAFRAFYDVTYPLVYQFAHYFLPNKADCEEVVSEVFYIIWKQRATLFTVNSIKAWLYVVCRNEAYRYLKQKEK
ncbi:MAG: hypothetical protein LBN71_02435, partial [Tannerella sp.]|nr:hypothetical protein [Tannerella sp.]